jgi:hypothetical protein
MCPQRRHSEVWCSFQAKAIFDFYLAFGTLKSDRKYRHYLLRAAQSLIHMAIAWNDKVAIPDEYPWTILGAVNVLRLPYCVSDAIRLQPKQRNTLI